ncbi:MAG: hypothetical protein ABF575_00370 [Liquorilactobacillus hordei]|uniref:hypothetical protein n=1 Tax=Liquorilactobacillus hordei TaxID=468911 RepID=UPI0039EAC14D
MELRELEGLTELAREAEGKKTFEVNGRTYFIDGRGDLEVVKETSIPQSPVTLHTLTGLLDYIVAEGKSFSNGQDTVLWGARLRIDNPTTVYFEGSLDKYGRRPVQAIAKFQTPDFEFGDWHDQEEMNIAMQAAFVETDDRDVILKVIGNLKESDVKQASDDGVTQQVQIKSGVASLADVKVPNPVVLAPYRTFLEVKQPESKFIFRMRSGMMSAIFEADGGMWKIEAGALIKQYLEDELKKLELDLKVIA